MTTPVPDPPAPATTAEATNEGGLLTAVRTASFSLAADEPVEAGGTGQGPAPYQLLLAALGACTAMTVRLYAEHKGWPLGRVHVALARYKADPAAGRPREVFERVLTFHGDLTADQRARLVEIALRCPVSRTLGAGAELVARTADL